VVITMPSSTRNVAAAVATSSRHNALRKII
jgi:hypothetical protein